MSDPNKISSIYPYGTRLFLKFFFWFWAIAAATTIIVSLYAYYFHIKPEIREFDRIHYENLLESATYMAEAYEKDGVEAAAVLAVKGVEWFFDENLDNLLKEMSAFPGAVVKNKLFSVMRNFKKRPETLVASDGKPLVPEVVRSRFETPEFSSFVSINKDRIASFAARIMHENKSGSLEIEDFYFQGCLVQSSTGRKYVAIRHLPWKSKKKHWFMLDRIFAALPLLILISAPLCFFLVRYMARPIIDISEASRKFAGGDLTTRVSSDALQRRDEIGDLAADFNQMAHRLEDMIKGQQKLFGDISHELRSPLARLQIALEILDRKASQADRPMLQRIDLEITRLNHLIGKLLELNRLSLDDRSLLKNQVDLPDLLEKLCQDGRFEASVRKVQISLHSESSLQVMADAYLLEQAIENILRNAIKYSPEGSEIKVVLKEDSQNRRAVITITDQGPGIAEIHLPKIFAPFYRCQDDRDRKTGGVGLGLAIAFQAVKAHDGNLVLSNPESGGLKAEISLPL